MLSALSKMLAIMADGAEEIPMPAPWAAAVAVMALLAFGVLVGSTISPASPSGGPTRVLLAAGPAARNPGSPAGQAAPPPAAAEATPVPSSEEEAASESTQTPEGESKADGKSKSSHSGSKGKSAPNAGPTPSGSGLPPVKHVFLIVLSDQSLTADFGSSSSSPYLSKTLARQGELIENYYATSQGELANAIALISGQGPTPQTASDCPLYADLAPGTLGAEGQVLGSGCVYPGQTLSLADQLTAAGKTWRAYVEDIDAGGSSCRHPALGAADTENPNASDGYVAWRNPFVYFHSLIDGAACASADVGLDKLAGDLKSAKKTPSFAYIAPDRCDDGSATPCAPGQPAGLAGAEAFLRKVLAEIEASPAYKEGGLIALTADEAPQGGAGADSSGCCVSGPYPNMPTVSSPAGATTGSPATSAIGAGGGKVGLLLISKYVKPGSLNVLGEYDHFSLLLSIEKLLGLKPLGYAGAKSLLAFDSSVFNANH